MKWKEILIRWWNRFFGPYVVQVDDTKRLAFEASFDISGKEVFVQTEDAEILEQILDMHVRSRSFSLQSCRSELTVTSFLLLHQYWSTYPDEVRSSPDLFLTSEDSKRLRSLGLIEWDKDRGIWSVSDKATDLLTIALWGTDDPSKEGWFPSQSVQEKVGFIPWYKASPDGRFSLWCWITGPIILRKLFRESDYFEIYRRSNGGWNHKLPDWDMVDKILEDSYDLYPFMRELHDMHKIDRKIRFIMFPETGCPSKEEVAERERINDACRDPKILPGPDPKSESCSS